jgi:hypothetical protein
MDRLLERPKPEHRQQLPLGVTTAWRRQGVLLRLSVYERVACRAEGRTGGSG